jgi:hypothetical protein
MIAMDDLWASPPEEPDYLQTSPMESSHPSFPFVDREVVPLDLASSSSPSIPPPPPPPMVAGANEQTKPIVVGISAGTAIGIIAGTMLALCVFAVLLGVVLTHAGLLGGANGSSLHTAGSSSSASSAKTPGPSDGVATTSSNTGIGTPATRGATPPTKGTVSPTGTGSPGTATPTASTATPAPLPLTVNGSAQDHQSLTMDIQTQPGATLTITLTYCDGSTDARYNDFMVVTASGTYTDTVTGTPKCRPGVAEGTLAVQAHLSGYQDASMTIAISQGH